MRNKHFIASKLVMEDYYLCGDPDIYEVYRDNNGKWDIEWHGC